MATNNENIYGVSLLGLLILLILYVIFIGFTNVFTFSLLFFFGKKTTGRVKDLKTFTGNSSEGGTYQMDSFKLDINTIDGKIVEGNDKRDYTHGEYRSGQIVDLIYLPYNPNRLWIGKKISVLWFLFYLLILILGLVALSAATFGVLKVFKINY